MMWILAIGSIIAIVNVVLTYNELIPWFTAIKQLGDYSKKYPTFKNQFLYPFRFISLLPKAMPVALDVLIALIAGSLGLNGGVYGALIGLTIGFTASLLVKFHRHFIAPKLKVNTENWKVFSSHELKATHPDLA